jgi:hypothetical protein
MQAIDALKERVRRMVEAQEDPTKADMPAQGMVDSMRDHLSDVTAYLDLLANRLEYRYPTDGG